jgi:hypothetical protein
MLISGLLGQTMMRSKRSADGFGGFGERFAFGEHRGAMNVGSKIAITEIEPVDPAEHREPFQRVEGLAAKSPAFCRVDDAGQRVGHDVEVRRNFQPVEGDVIAGIDDRGEARGVGDVVEA